MAEQPRDSKGQFAEAGADGKTKFPIGKKDSGYKFDSSDDPFGDSADDQGEATDSTEGAEGADLHEHQTTARVHGEKAMAHAHEAAKAHGKAAKAAHAKGDHEGAKKHEKAQSLLEHLAGKGLAEAHEHIAEHFEELKEKVKEGHELGKWAAERALSPLGKGGE